MRYDARVRWFLLAVLVACDGKRPQTCGEAECDPTSELCLVLGSDIAGEPPVARCLALSAACMASKACPCLTDADVGVSVEFCTREGSCRVELGLIQLACPGG